MCSHYEMPSLKEIKTYLKTNLKLPLVVSKNIEDKFESVTQIYPKSPSLIMLYSDDELKLVEKKSFLSDQDKARLTLKQQHHLENDRLDKYYVHADLF